MRRLLPTLVAGALVVAACSGAVDTADTEATPAPDPDPETTAVREYPDAIQRRLWRMASEPRPVENSAMPPRHLDEERFPEVLVQRDRIVYGGRLPDQIPAIDEPQFAPADQIDWLADDEAVLVLQAPGSVRAYPVQVHPDAPVLTRDTGHRRSYGRNPYVGYDTIDKPLTGFYTGDVDDRLAPMARVVGIHSRSESVAVEISKLGERGVVELVVDGRHVTVWHQPGLASSLDAAQVGDGDDVGAVGVFSATTDAGPASFRRDDAGNFVDDRTGSTWNILGEAVAGPAVGERLEPITHVDTFWFAWSSYRPATDLAE